MNFWKTAAMLAIGSRRWHRLFGYNGSARRRLPVPRDRNDRALSAGGPSDVWPASSPTAWAELNQTIVIENVGGAGGTIGTARVASAEPTATRCSPPAWGRMLPHLRSLPPQIQLDQDFEPIGLISQPRWPWLHEEGFPGQGPERVHRLRERERTRSIRRTAASARPRIWPACCSICRWDSSRTPSPIGGPGRRSTTSWAAMSISSANRSSASPRRPRVAHQGLCGVGRRALGGAAGRAVGQGSRELPVLPAQHLERDFRAEGHAEAGRGQAQRRPEQGAGRSGRGQTAGRSRRQRSAQGGSRPGAVLPRCSRPTSRAGIRCSRRRCRQPK